ncbi:MAG: hypothetical protein LBP28_06580 [Coriobacteriales bacterium]|nr:hypothetical protein [Coriobacteriales bacterium]
MIRASPAAPALAPLPAAARRRSPHHCSPLPVAALAPLPAAAPPPPVAGRRAQKRPVSSTTD